MATRTNTIRAGRDAIVATDLAADTTRAAKGTIKAGVEAVVEAEAREADEAVEVADLEDVPVVVVVVEVSAAVEAIGIRWLLWKSIVLRRLQNNLIR